MFLKCYTSQPCKNILTVWERPSQSRELFWNFNQIGLEYIGKLVWSIFSAMGGGWGEEGVARCDPLIIRLYLLQYK